jgi:transposase
MLRLQIAELRKFIFSGKQEAFKPDPNANKLQAALFPESSIGEVVTTSIKKIDAYEKKTTAIRVNHPGRNPISDHLRRETVRLDPPEDVGDLKPIGEEITEQLEYNPGEVYVKRYVRPEYLKPNEDNTEARRIIADLPAFPISKSYAGASLLSHLMVSKFVDHLPIYRQLEIFKRQNVHIDATTVSNWIKEACNLIVPLYEAHKKEVLSTNYLNVDETPIKVLDKGKKGTTHQGYYWVYYNTLNKNVLFEYQQGRSGSFPREVLKDYQGYLQTDGYAGYDQFDKIPGVVPLNCWAHARRKFFDAQDSDKEKASKVLIEIQSLYAVEAYCHDMAKSAEEVNAHRHEYASTVLHNLHITLQEQLATTLPSSPLGKALQYTLARWDKLNVYLQDGYLRIDNNLIENSIRPVALGRKNYLFAGSHEAAQRGAMLYSLFATCRLHNLDPQAWLTDVLRKINDTKINSIKELLPQNYIKQ